MDRDTEQAVARSIQRQKDAVTVASIAGFVAFLAVVIIAGIIMGSLGVVSFGWIMVGVIVGIVAGASAYSWVRRQYLGS